MGYLQFLQKKDKLWLPLIVNLVDIKLVHHLREEPTIKLKELIRYLKGF